MSTWVASTQYFGHLDFGSSKISSTEQFAIVIEAINAINENFRQKFMMIVLIEFFGATKICSYFIIYVQNFISLNKH